MSGSTRLKVLGPVVGWLAAGWIAANGLAGCGGSATPSAAPSGQTSADGGADADAPVHVARPAVVDGPAASDAGASGDASSVIYPMAPAPIVPPGVTLTSESAVASLGPCAGTSLGDVLAAIRKADPTLADVLTLYNPATTTGDGSFIYAYDVGAAGFDVIFKRGLGDCVAGCTENDYEYFSTDPSAAACSPVRVGHYHAAWGTGTCLTVEGAPMWAHPQPPDPLTVCGQDNSAADLRGTYGVHATGQRTACALGAVASSLEASIQFVIQQDAKDLSTGFVTFSFTGEPTVDGVPLPAQFQRRRFQAALMSTNSDNSCSRQASVTARFDFEGFQPGGIDALDSGDDACLACKGSLSLVLAGN